MLTAGVADPAAGTSSSTASTGSSGSSSADAAAPPAAAVSPKPDVLLRVQQRHARAASDDDSGRDDPDSSSSDVETPRTVPAVRVKSTLVRARPAAEDDAADADASDSPPLRPSPRNISSSPSAATSGGETLLDESVSRVASALKGLALFFTFQSTLEPSAPPKVLWDWYIILLALYQFFFTCWYISFDESLGSRVAGTDWFVTISFWLDMVITFRTGFIDYSGNAIFDPRLIADRYLRGMFLLDLLAAVPFHVFAPLISFSAGTSHQFVENCLKVNFLIRASKLVNSERIDAFISPTARIGKLLFAFFGLSHFFGSLFWFVGRVQQADSTWIIAKGLENKPVIEQYIASLYWALTTMVTVGYGDIVPVTVYEQATVIPILMLSALVYATVFGNMAYAIETITSTIRRYQSRMDLVKEFVQVYELPSELQQKLFDYTNAQWATNKGFETEEMLSHLPTSVKAEVLMFINKTLIERVPLFKQCSDRFLEAMILRMDSQVCLPGDFVFKEGDKSREMYFVRSGSVNVIMEVGGSDTLIANIGSYSDYPFIGEISLLLGEPRTASAQAKTKCVLSRLSQQDFFDVLSQFPEEENSLRETATLRLEQDIERETRMAVKKRGVGVGAGGAAAVHSGSHSANGKRKSLVGDELDAVQMAVLAGVTAQASTASGGNKYEARLHSLHHAAAADAAHGSFSTAPAIHAPGSPLVGPMTPGPSHSPSTPNGVVGSNGGGGGTVPQSMDREVGAGGGRLSRLNNSAVRQNLFAGAGGSTDYSSRGNGGGAGRLSLLSRGSSFFEIPNRHGNGQPMGFGAGGPPVTTVVDGARPGQPFGLPPASAASADSPQSSPSGGSMQARQEQQQLSIDVTSAAGPGSPPKSNGSMQYPAPSSGGGFAGIAEEDESSQIRSGINSARGSVIESTALLRTTSPPMMSQHGKQLTDSSHTHTRRISAAEKYQMGLAKLDNLAGTPKAVPAGAANTSPLDALAALRKKRDGEVSASAAAGGAKHRTPGSSNAATLNRIVNKLNIGSSHASLSPKMTDSARSLEGGNDDAVASHHRRLPSAAAFSPHNLSHEDKYKVMEHKLAELTKQMSALIAMQANQPGTAPKAGDDPADVFLPTHE